MAGGAGLYENGAEGALGHLFWRHRRAGSGQRGAMTLPKKIRSAGAPHSAQAFMARLRLDHARLSRVLREIEVQRSRLGSEPAAARAVLGEALRYLVDYLHGHHHPREDLLYARLLPLRADLGDELRALAREHDGGAGHARQLAGALRRLPAGGTREAERFARALQDYVDETREHMRREERAVFYAGVEPWLSDAEWQSLAAQALPDDPLEDANRLRRHYPHLAAALAEPVRDVSSGTGTAPTAQQPHARPVDALRDGADELIEAYGELLHEGFDLLRANVATLWGASSPLGAVGALPEVSRRSYQFAARCIALPSKVALECASRMLGPVGGAGEPTDPKERERT
jgi:hemerythrin-like domain-containing protein